MAEFIAQNMAPIMFASLVIFLLIGYPVAFSLAACGIVFFIIGVEVAPLSHGTITLSWPLLGSLPHRLYAVVNNDVLLAIPFFTLMGLVLERSGMAEDLLDSIGQLFGTVRGGLAYAVIFAAYALYGFLGPASAFVLLGLVALATMTAALLHGPSLAALGQVGAFIAPVLVASDLHRAIGRRPDATDGDFLGTIKQELHGTARLARQFRRHDPLEQGNGCDQKAEQCPRDRSCCAIP